MKPIRIQRKRTKGWKSPPNTVYVGRPSEFGNPFTVKEMGSARDAVSLFRAKCLTIHILSESDPSHILNIVEKLRGKNLSCWCKIGDPCHADVLLKIANYSAKQIRKILNV